MNLSRGVKTVRRYALTTAVVAAVAVVFAASPGLGSNQSSTSVRAGGHTTLTIGLLGDIGQPPDPDVYYNSNGQEIILNTYQGLVTYQTDTQNPKIIPLLATSWKISNNFKTYTFYLRKGVTFHDGTPFTSRAVRASFARRTAVNGGAAYMVADVASVSTPNPLTAVVHLKTSNSAFLDYLACGFGPKMESPTGLAKYAGSDHDQTYLRTHDLGTGPYELTDVQIGVKYVLTQYPKYWGKKSPFQTVNLPVYTDPSALQLAVQSGQVDLTFQMPNAAYQTVLQDSNLRSYKVHTAGSAIMFLNPSRQLFSSRAARVAFLQFVDKQSIVPAAFGPLSIPGTSLYPEGMVANGADREKFAYNPAAWANYASKLPKNTSLVVGYAANSPPANQAANILAAKLLPLGLNATAVGYTVSQVVSWPSNPTSGPDVFIDGNNGPDGPALYLFGQNFWSKNGGINYFDCDVPATDKLLNEGLATGSLADYVKAAQIYSANGCYYNLAHNIGWIVAQKWVTGVLQSQTIGWGKPMDISQLGAS